MERKRGKIAHFSCFQVKVREGLFKKNSRICPWRRTSFFEGMIESRFHDLLRVKLVS
jgi:hypothetical protein